MLRSDHSVADPGLKFGTCNRFTVNPGTLIICGCYVLLTLRSIQYDRINVQDLRPFRRELRTSNYSRSLCGDSATGTAIWQVRASSGLTFGFCGHSTANPNRNSSLNTLATTSRSLRHPFRIGFWHTVLLFLGLFFAVVSFQ